MRRLLLLVALAVAGLARPAAACDCQKQQQARCSCASQSCPGACEHNDAQKPDDKKPKKSRRHTSA
jgi:hypothetical protein